MKSSSLFELSDLPSSMVDFKNACIDYAHGRIPSLPKDIDKFFQWMLDEDNKSSIYEAEFILALAKSWFEDYDYSDYQLAYELSIDESELTDHDRVEYIRDKIEEDLNNCEHNILSIQALVIRNHEGEEAIIGVPLEVRGQAGVFACGDFMVYKNINSYYQDIEKDYLILIDMYQKKEFNRDKIPKEIILKNLNKS